MIVDPWGVVLATAPDTETFIVAELDLTMGLVGAASIDAITRDLLVEAR